MNAPEGQPLNLRPACLHLRHKLMYIDDRHMRIGVVDTDSDTRIYLCNQTGEPLGPDSDIVTPKACCPGRICYVHAPTAQPVPGIDEDDSGQ